jgi:hypothetical protein
MRYYIFIINLFICGIIVARESSSKDFYKEIQNYNTSDLWTLRQVCVDGGNTLTNLPDPIGFIGSDFQRFYIHFSSAIQNPYNRYEYLVYGQTRVKTNICTFQGRFMINESRLYLTSDIPDLKQGFIIGNYELFEDSDKKGAGIIKGKFRSNFYINVDGKIKYDAISLMADGFENNQFEGTWTAYESRIEKICNWGDFRIPGSKDLDEGAGEFMPTSKYINNGWKDYINENEGQGDLTGKHEWWQIEKK